MTCTRCGGCGFLNLEHIPDAELTAMNDDTDKIMAWIRSHPEADAKVCDCCGDGDSHFGIPGEHDHRDFGKNGPYASNGGLPQCY